MTRTRLRNVTLPAAALVAVLTAGNARAQGEPANATNDMKAVRELLERIDKRLAAQQATSDILLDIVKQDLKDLRGEVARLNKELTDLKNRPAAPATSSSNYQGTPSTSLSVGAPPATAPTSSVRLVNTYFSDMSAVVNGVLVTVPPGQERVVTVPAGAMNYQVYQVPGPLQQRTLMPNETLTLTLRPF